MGQHDELENRYVPKFEALLSASGVVVGYRHDRAGIDTGHDRLDLVFGALLRVAA